MAGVVSLFWNREERRPAAFWRIAIQLIARVALIVILLLLTREAAVALGFLEPGVGLSYVLKTWAPDQPAVVVVQRGVEVVAALGSVALCGRFLDKRRFGSFGFSLRNKMWWLDLAAGHVVALIVMASIVGAGWIMGWISVVGWHETGGSAHALWVWVLAGFVACLANGLEEEVADGRGYMMRNAAEGFRGKWMSPRAALVGAWLITSVVFGLAHYSPEGGLRVMVMLTVVGLLFALPYALTGQLGLSIGLHSAWNFSQTYLVNLWTRDERTTSLLSVRWEGPEAWTGGAFAPEGGLLGLVGCAIGALTVLAWVRATRGGLRLAAEAFVYEGSSPAQPVARPDGAMS